MEEELWDMKAHKAYISQVDFVANAQQGIPQLCPCGSIMKRTVDEVDTYDYLPGKRFFICKDFEVSIDSLSMLIMLIMLLRYLFAVWLVSLYLFGRMTVFISGNHGSWLWKKRSRGSNNAFTIMTSFWESVKHLRYVYALSKDTCLL